MNCEEVSLMLNAILDGELTFAERTFVEQHLDDCPACREQFVELQGLDATLQRALEPPATTHVIDRALNAISTKSEHGRPNGLTESPSPAHKPTPVRYGEFRRPPHAPPRRSAIGTMVAMMCTLVISIAMFAQMSREAPAVAEITMSRGPIDIRRTGTAQWTTVENRHAVLLPAEARIRTRDNSLCEIRTKSDTVVRLNHETELVLHRSEQIELVSGEVWCRTPSTKSLEISTAKTPRLAKPEAIFTCPTSTESRWQASVDQTFSCTCVSPNPIEVAVNSLPESCTVGPGETFTFASGSTPLKSGHGDRLELLAWQLPLLIMRNPRDQELKQRMTELLAAAGHSKMSYLYEEQIRQLGPPGTLPLIAFVCSSESREQPKLRRGAMGIISDLAPSSSEADLESLLNDKDDVVKRLAIRALHRLQPDRKFDSE